jgi:hypothetical protein
VARHTAPFRIERHRPLGLQNDVLCSIPVLRHGGLDERVGVPDRSRGVPGKQNERAHVGSLQVVQPKKWERPLQSCAIPWSKTELGLNQKIDHSPIAGGTKTDTAVEENSRPSLA